MQGVNALVVFLLFSFSNAVVETPLWSDSIIDRYLKFIVFFNYVLMIIMLILINRWCVAVHFDEIEYYLGNKTVGVNLIKVLIIITMQISK